MRKKIILRIDDVGASSKQFEVYSKTSVGNFLFLKYFPPFAAWGPYYELDAKTWHKILKILKKYGAKMTVAVTASWVEKDGNLIPFPQKFPRQAKVLEAGIRANLIEIANHGLTHCIVGKHLPRLFTSNRKYHREFWGWLPKSVHLQNLEKSQQILQDYFGRVVTFVPPGNIWTTHTETAAAKLDLKFFCSNLPKIKTGQKSNGLIYISDSQAVVLHDRDIVKKGIWRFEEKIRQFSQKEFKIVTVKDFARSLT